MKVIESRQNRPEVNPTYAAQTRAQIQQLLGLPSADGFTIIQWNPTVVRPAEASYVILKQRIAELGNFFCRSLLRGRPLLESGAPPDPAD